MSATELKTSTESVGKDRVKLTVEVPEDALKPALDAVYKRWAREIKVPGFRPGKVPRQMIDARVGPEVVRHEAIDNAMDGFYRDALDAAGLQAIAPPDDVKLIENEPGRPLVFEATVELRPEFSLPDFTSLKVEAPESAVTDDDVTEQLDRLRDRFAELETIGRDARRGDFVLIDLKGYKNDEPVEGASAPDFLYEIGSQQGPPKLDSELEGVRPGAILKFTDEVHIHTENEPEHDHSHMDTISFTVLVKEVKAKKLPALDDEFAKTVGEFDTLDALKEDLKGRLAEVKEGMAEEEMRSRVLDALVDATELDAPEKLVETEFDLRLSHFEQDLRSHGLTMDQYAAQAQLTELEIRKDIRTQVARAIKAELILEEVARGAEVQVTQEDIGQEIAMAAVRAGKDAKEVAEQVVSSGRLGTVAADIMRRKALDHVVQSVNVLNRHTEGA